MSGGASGEPSGRDRRSFLALLLGSLAALAAGLAGLAYLVIASRRPVTPEPGPLVSLSPVPVVALGAVYELSPHGVPGFLARPGAGLIALSNRCTHQACAVPFNPVTGRFECLCHGSRFALDGAVLAGPAARPLEYFPARLEGDRLIIDATGGARRREHAGEGVIAGS